MNYTLNDSYQNFQDCLLNIKDHFNKIKNNIHKARNELKILTCSDIEIVVKSFKIPNIFNKVIYTFFRDSKAKKSYYNSLKLKDFTPKPIGYIEFFKNGLLDESYFISERFDYDFTIREPLLDSNFIQREQVLQAFARFSFSLHNEGIFHKDFSPGNILIKKKNNSYSFKVVDINRMRFLTLTVNDRARNFSKLWASDKDLNIIATEYAKNAKLDEDFIHKALYYSHKNKQVKNFKKRLKGQKIDW